MMSFDPVSYAMGAKSGGGSSTGGGVLRVNFAVDFTDPENPTVTGEKTPLEVAAAFESGTYFYGYVASADGIVLTPTLCNIEDGYASVQMSSGDAQIVNDDNDSWIIIFL